MSVRSSLGRFGIVTADALSAIVTHDKGGPTALAVYVSLATRADRQEETAWRCSVKSIADEAGVSERSVRNAKLVLVDLGLLEVFPNFTTDGDRGWDSYLIHYVPRPATPAEGPATPAGGPATPAGGPVVTAGYSSDQETDQETEFFAPSQAMDAVADDDFELFWSTYRRTGPKKKARECWLKATKKADPGIILAGLIDWMDYWDSPGAASMKWPQGWLNNETWNDEPPFAAARKPKQSSMMDSITRIRERDSQ